MAEHNLLGRRGEDIATAFLLGKGYSLLDRNWHSGRKEIDIVAQDGADIVFVEVKTRSSEDLFFASDAVDARKRRLLVQAADSYLRSHTFNLKPRFDILTIVGHVDNPDEPLQVEHLVDAFLPPVITSRKRRTL